MARPSGRERQKIEKERFSHAGTGSPEQQKRLLKKIRNKIYPRLFLRAGKNIPVLAFLLVPSEEP